MMTFTSSLEDSLESETNEESTAPINTSAATIDVPKSSTWVETTE